MSYWDLVVAGMFHLGWDDTLEEFYLWQDEAQKLGIAVHHHGG